MRRGEPVENLEQRRLARPVPDVVVLGGEERAVAHGALDERLVEHGAHAAVEALVRPVEAAVIERLVDELDVLPRAVEQDPRQRQVRDAEQVGTPHPAGEPVACAPRRKRLGQRLQIDAGLEIDRKLAQLLEQPLLAPRGHRDPRVEPSCRGRRRIVCEDAREVAELADEELDIDLHRLAGLESSLP